jgi:predicted membrane-bound spermidine synthase
MQRPSDESRAALYVSIFAISLAVILMEIAYTRIFSFKVYYYFTYLIIGISLLGLGTGGVAVAIVERVRNAPLGTLVPICSLSAGIVVSAGYFVIANVQLTVLELTSSPLEMAQLTLLSVILFAPFFIAGIAIAAMFAGRPDEIGRLYGADLIGAALGCTIIIPLMMAIQPPACVILSASIFAVAGLPLSWRRHPALSRAAGIVGVCLLGLVLFRGVLPDPSVDATKDLDAYRRAGLVVYSRWSPVFRIDVGKHPFHPEQSHVIFHDGQLGSKLHGFDGDFSALGEFRQDPRSYPFAVLGGAPRVLIIGSAGGHEILASLYFGAGHVTGVELNPVTVGLLRGPFAEYTGHLAGHERVTVVQGEGRSFLKQADDAYDLIWLVAPDSYAAMNAASSAAFVLSESYLYTVEMIEESLAHLDENGILCAQFGELDYTGKPNRTARYISTARRAFDRLGMADFDRHVLVGTVSEIEPFALSTVLLKTTPFTPAEIERFLDNDARVTDTTVRHVPGRVFDDGAVNQLIDLPTEQLAAWFDAHEYDVSPVVDDAPFFWHFARFSATLRGPLTIGYEGDWEDAIGERVLIALLIFVILFASVFLLLPFVTIRSVWREIPWKGRAGVYFAALGMGFMLLEVCLIQMLTLFLGYPTYSLSVTLFGLLVFSGIGSLISGRYQHRRNRSLGLLLAAVAGLVVFYQYGMPMVIEHFVGSALGQRIALAIVMIAPLGVCLGGFMPLGLGTVAALTPHSREYVAWGWAVNGFFSVITSILSTILAMTFGFKVALFLALVVYAIGVAAMARVPAPGR